MLIFCVKYTFFLFTVLCASIVTPSSGNVSLSYDNTVTSAQFDCATGYYISGALSATCRADGTWNKPPPTCSKFDITKIRSKGDQYNCILMISMHSILLNLKLQDSIFLAD